MSVAAQASAGTHEPQAPWRHPAGLPCGGHLKVQSLDHLVPLKEMYRGYIGVETGHIGDIWGLELRVWVCMGSECLGLGLPTHAFPGAYKHARHKAGPAGFGLA